MTDREPTQEEIVAKAIELGIPLHKASEREEDGSEPTGSPYTPSED